MNLFFPNAGRISRKSFWMAQIGYIIVGLAASAVMYGLTFIFPNQSTEPGQFSVNGLAALPYLAVGFLTGLFVAVSSIVVAIKRFHDRDKSGYWYFINLIPFIGSLWCLIELGFLPGTAGANRFGPSPLSGGAAFAPYSAAA